MKESLDLGLRLQKRLRESMRQRTGPPEELRRRLQSPDRTWWEPWLRVLEEEYEIAARALNTAPVDLRFAHRIQQLVLEDLRAERSSPPINPLPEPCPAEEKRLLPEGAFLHLLLFEYLPYAGNEVFPLMIDALTATGVSSRFQVGGAHVSWISPEFQITRILLYDLEKDLLVELPLSSSRAAHGVHFLCFSAAEHRAWSERAAVHGVHEINPYSAAAIADSKGQCYERWKVSGIPTPRTLLLSADSTLDTMLSTLIAFARESTRPRIVIQPDHGTEGEGIFVIERAALLQDGESELSLLAALESIHPRDDVLVREYIEPERPERTHAVFDLRVNVSWDGERFAAESGYWLMAPDGGWITSPRRGGKVVKLHAAGESVPDWARIPDVLEAARREAERAAAALEPVGLMGVDVRLEFSPTGVVPWILDANPRPAGLTHSEYFDSHEPGVSRVMWKWITQWIEE